MTFSMPAGVLTFHRLLNAATSFGGAGITLRPRIRIGAARVEIDDCARAAEAAGRVDDEVLPPVLTPRPV